MYLEEKEILIKQSNSLNPWVSENTISDKI